MGNRSIMSRGGSETEYSANTLCRVIDHSEFSHQWRPVYDRVFTDPLHDPLYPERSPFRQSDWEIVGIPSDLAAGHIFLPFGEPDREKKPSDVEFDISAPLYRTLEHFGVREIIATQEGIFAEHPKSWLYRATAEGRRSLPSEAEFELAHFSSDATWGLITSCEDSAVIAGSPDFIKIYMRYSGGQEVARKVFQIKYVESKGYFYLMTRGEALKRHYAMLGWDCPPIIEDAATRQMEVCKRADDLKILLGWGK